MVWVAWYQFDIKYTITEWLDLVCRLCFSFCDDGVQNVVGFIRMLDSIHISYTELFGEFGINQLLSIGSLGN